MQQHGEYLDGLRGTLLEGNFPMKLLAIFLMFHGAVELPSRLETRRSPEGRLKEH